ncbi:hypothetical protein AgCh_034723 [Apium graveolens]
MVPSFRGVPHASAYQNKRIQNWDDICTLFASDRAIGDGAEQYEESATAMELKNEVVSTAETGSDELNKRQKRDRLADAVTSFVEYSIEELRPVVHLQEGGVRGQRPPGVCLDGRPPPVVNECRHLGCGSSRGSLSGDKDASNIWGEPWLYLRPWTRETAGSGGLSLAREMPYP